VKGNEDTWMNLSPPGTFEVTSRLRKLDEIKAQPRFQDTQRTWGWCCFWAKLGAGWNFSPVPGSRETHLQWQL